MRQAAQERIDLDQCLLAGEALPDVEALDGEHWFPLETTIEQDMIPYWGGDWGCASEVRRLRAVLLYRPGPEIERFQYETARFRAPIDPEKFRAQHDALADYYRDRGVAVYYVEQGRSDRPNAVFCRDKLFMTPEGAIITRLSMAGRRGEERFVAESCARLGIPIVKTIAGDGIFEGTGAMWVDRHTVILSLGVRANRSGYEQMETELRRQGVTDILPMQIPYGHTNIDGLLNLAGEDTVVIHACQVPYEVVDALRRKGYRILEIPSFTEARYGFATNFVALEPGHVVMGNQAPRTAELLEKSGIRVDVLDLSELGKGDGSVHSITAFLKRDAE